MQVPEDMGVFVGLLNRRFEKREDNDIGRIRQVLKFACHEGCLTQYVLNYFGEERPACGHCGNCQEAPTATLNEPAPTQFSTQDEERIRDLIVEGHASIRKPRKIARFLCGITSPATTKAKLRQQTNLFGAYDSVPFKSVLKFTERVMSSCNS